MWGVMSFSLKWPQKIYSPVRMISFRPNVPKSLNVADDYFCAFHISPPDLLEIVNVINFEVSIYVALQTVTLPSSNKGWDFKFAHWKQPVKVFSSSKQYHCSRHQEGLNANISLISAPAAANLSMQTSWLHFSVTESFILPSIFFSLFYYLEVRWFSTAVFCSSVRSLYCKLGTQPTKTLWIYRITAFVWEVWGRLGLGYSNNFKALVILSPKHRTLQDCGIRIILPLPLLTVRSNAWHCLSRPGSRNGSPRCSEQ